MSAPDTPLTSVLRAAVTPGPLVVAVVTAALAYFVVPWFVVPGAMLYAAMVYFEGPFRLSRSQRSLELGLDLKDAPPGLKRWNLVLNETLHHIKTNLQHAQGQNARLLQPVGTEVQALGNDIRRLIRQAYVLHQYLKGTNLQFIAARVEHLDAQAAATQDPYSRQQLVEASAALQRQLANCEQIRLLIGRTEATLENMQASLQSIGSSVVKLGVGDVADATQARQDSLDRLANARSTVASLETVLQQVELG